MANEEKVIYPLRLDPAVYERLKDFALKEDLSAAQVIRRALRRELKAIEAGKYD